MPADRPFERALDRAAALEAAAVECPLEHVHAKDTKLRAERIARDGVLETASPGGRPTD